MKIKQEHGKIILRIGISLVFLWFGIRQLYSPNSWTNLIPEFFSSLIGAKNVVLMNGGMEVILGLMLLTGLYVRVVALILGLHLLSIASLFGFNPTGVRDMGLAVATISIFFFGSDKLCLDEIIYPKDSKQN